MARPPLDLSLYLVTDTRLCGAFGVPATVGAAVGAGVTLVQLRDPDASDDEFVALGRALVTSLRQASVPLIVNDRVHLVDAIGADGAHVGQSDTDVADARALLRPDAYLGLSIETAEQLSTAMGAYDTSMLDYVGVGPVWAQSTKLDAAAPTGLDALAEIVTRSPWPCVAIGGVGIGRVTPVRAAGADGVAVVSAICGQGDPARAARALRDEWDAADGRRVSA